MQRFSLPSRIAQLRHRFGTNTVRFAGAGFLAGVFCLSWLLQLTSTFGSSLAVSTATALAIVASFVFGWPTEGAKPRFRSRSIAVLLAGWTLLLPWLMQGLSAGLDRVPLEWWSHPAINLGLLCVITFGLLTGPMACLARWPFVLNAESESETNNVLRSFGFGWVSAVFVLSYLLGPHGLFGVTVNIVAITTGVVSVWFAFKKRGPEVSEPQVSSQSQRLAVSVRLASAVFVCGLGGAVAVWWQSLTQLMPISSYLLWTGWSSVLLGLVLGSTSPRFSRMVAGVVAAIWMMSLPAIFPQLTAWSVQFNANVTSVLGLMLLRGGLVAVCLFPAGWCWGRFLQDRSSNAASAWPIPRFEAFAVGYLILRWVGLSSFSVSSLTLAFAVIFLLCVAVVWRPRWSEQRFRIATGAFVTTGLLAVCFATADYQPNRSVRVLFDSTVSMAAAAGLDDELLPFVDESRLLDRRVTPETTWTVWKTRGHQIQLRRDGLPAGAASLEPRLAPQSSADVLPSVMPLVLHSRPNHVLIMGLESGIALETVLAFPVPQVTCIEPSRTLVSLLQEHVWSTRGLDPLADPRLTLKVADPVQAIRSDASKFDVVISLPHHPATADGTAEMTAEFYQQVSETLEDGGLFCQKFSHIDFGPSAIRTVARTMRSAFAEVVFLEIAAGQLAMFGSNTPGTLANTDLVDRLQKPHVREALSHIGMDWAVPLNLPAYNTENLDEMLAKGAWWENRNTSANGRFAFGLPPEMMQWGPKYQRTQAMLSPYTERFANWGTVPADDRVLLRRFSEIVMHNDLMAGVPDEYWLYRKSTKDQIMENPRSLIRQVGGEIPKHDIHPEDRRRMNYFKALDQALKTLDANDIASVANYATPYDPLVSDFLHKEVAELYSRCDPPEHKAELMHRLRAANFASAQEMSVRNVAKAIMILVEHPETMPDPLERFDQLNALVQTMKLRWAARLGYKPESSDVMLNDIEKSLRATELALEAMDEMAGELDISADDWKARRKFLGKTVVRPLRDYRRELMPYHLKKKMTKSALKAAQAKSASQPSSQVDEE